MDRRPGAEIHLRFLAGTTLHPPEREWLMPFHAARKTTYTRILASETVIADQILVDPLGGEAAFQLGDDDVPPRLTQTGLVRAQSAGPDSAEVGGADGRPGYF